MKKLFLNLSRRIEPEALSLVPIDKNDEDECFFRHNYENVFNKVLSKKTPKKDQPWNVQSKPEFTISVCPVSATIQKFDNSEVININFRVGKIGEINQMKCCFLFIFSLLGLMRKWYNFKLTSICFRSWNFAFQSHMVLRLFKSVLKLIVAKTRSRKLRY